MASHDGPDGARLQPGWVIHSFKSGKHFYVNTRTGEVTWEAPTDQRLAAERAAVIAQAVHAADVEVITAPLFGRGRSRDGSGRAATAAPTTAGDFDARLLAVLRAAERRDGAAGPKGGSGAESEYRQKLATANLLVGQVVALDVQGEWRQRLIEQAKTAMSNPEAQESAKPVLQAALGVIADSHAHDYAAAEAKATLALRELHNVLLHAGTGAEWEGAKELSRALGALMAGPSVPPSPQNSALESVREYGRIR